MASAAEQLAANLNLRAFSKATELKKRIWFTLAALIVYRLGTYIPLPGVDPLAMGQYFQQKGGGILDMFNMFSGGALQRMTIFALNIMPYVSASIIVQLMSAVSPALEAIKKEGESGRKKLNQYTRYLTVALACIQAYGLSVGLQAMHVGTHGGGGGGVPVVPNPGIFFQLSTIITLVGGTIFLMWLGEQITARGIGNGISLIIFSGIVAGLPRALLTELEAGRTGQTSSFTIVAIFIMVLAVVAFIVFMERAQRRIIIQYPKQQRGNKVFGGESTHMPLKVNTTGVIPPIFASSLLLLPLTLVGFIGVDKSGFWGTLSAELSHGKPAYMILYALLIGFFVFFYTAVVFNPADTAENLRKNGGFIPGIRPGKNTTDYLDYVLTRISVLGAAYLIFVCLFPEFLMSHFALPFYFGGTSLLIAVTVTMDTVAQVHSYLIAQQYEGLIKKAKLRGQRGGQRDGKALKGANNA